MDGLALSLLGPFSASVNGKPIEKFRSNRVQALLIYLATESVAGHTTFPRDSLLGLLWPGLPQRSAQVNLRTTIYRLKQVVEEQLPTGDGSPTPFLLADRKRLQLNPAYPLELDVADFRTLRQGSLGQQVKAVNLYRGDFLEDFYLPDAEAFEEWAAFRRAAYQREVLDTLSTLAERKIQELAFDEAETFARRQLALDNLRESAYRQLIETLARQGQRVESLAQYKALIEILGRELGVEPSAETRALLEEIRGGGLVIAPVVVVAAETDVRLPPFLQVGGDFVKPDQPGPGFVGRERELAWLHRRLEQAASGQGQVAFVLGDAGSGKTALLEAFVRSTAESHPETQVIWGTCRAFGGQSDPYLPFREALAILTGDVEAAYVSGLITRHQAMELWQAMPMRLQSLTVHSPELTNTLIAGPALLSRAALALPPASPLLAQVRELVARESAVRAGPRQGWLFEQIVVLLQQAAADKPVLLLLDDLQWADRGSTEILFQLARRPTTSRLLIVGAYRPEGLAPGSKAARHPLTSVLSEIKRLHGDVRLNLAKSEARSFVDRLLDREPNRLGDSFRGQLFALTGGHALFTTELLKEMQNRGGLVRDERGMWIEGPSLEWGRLPTRVEGVMEARIGRLDEELREILNVAAVEGYVFTVSVVSRAGKLDERQTLRSLSQELEKRHRLVEEIPTAQANESSIVRYQFAHALIQKYLYQQLSQGERRLLHSDVARSLEELYAGRLEEIASQMAWHYAEAGEEEKALPFLIQAGDRARLLYALEEAVTHYERVLAILKQQSRFYEAARILMKLGLTYHNAFEFKGAHQAYQDSFSLWQQAAREPTPSLPPAPHPLRLPTVEPATLDPALSTNTFSEAVIEQLFSGLVALNPEMDVVPDLAYRWEVLDGGRRYVFHLRNGATWSDGRPVTAHDFEYTWKRVLDPAMQAWHAHYFFHIKGAQAYHLGDVPDAESVGVNAMNDLTLRVLLERPSGHFLQMLAGVMARAVPRWSVEAHGDKWTEPKHIVSNGPFALASWVRGRSMTLGHNPNYHGRFSGNVRGVELFFFGAGAKFQAEMVARYEADQLDMLGLHGFETSAFNSLRHRHAEEYFSAHSATTLCLGFDCRWPPFDNPSIRRALVLALDRNRLANVVLGGRAAPASGGLVPPGLPGHMEGIALPYDPVAARRALVDGGFPEARNFPDTELISIHHLGSFVNSTYLLQQWLENLGIVIRDMVLSVREFADWNWAEDEKARLWLAPWHGANDLQDHLRVIERTGWQNDAYKELIERARGLMDQQERLALYGQIERILAAEAPIVPLSYPRRQILLKTWVRRFPISPLSDWFWKDVILEPHD